MFLIRIRELMVSRKMNVILLAVYVFLANMVPYSSSMYSNKAMEGYPAGYLSDCPEAPHEPTITKKSLKRLSFYLQGNGNEKTKYSYFQIQKLGSKMNFKKKTAIYVGGFLDFPTFLTGSSFGATYRELGYNALLLDTNYFTTMQYPVAALFARTVGKHTAEMLANLTKQGLDPKKLELVGLSLGSQTVSFIAKHYRNITGLTVSRVTGLDPAGPCFRNLGPESRIDQTDADFVDIISTNIDGFGMAAPVGHVNFYVNGGEFQPGDVIWMPCNEMCSHLRSFTLWMASLQNPDSFLAIQCDSVQEARSKNCYDKTPQVTNILGLKANKSKPGIFYLATDNNFPYYLGERGLKRENEYFSHLMKGIVESDTMIL